MGKRLFIAIILSLFLTSCSYGANSGGLKKVGLLVPETISDQVWGTKGYKGMLKIQSEFNVDVFYKEGISTRQMTALSIEEFKRENVNLIFGHGKEYAEHFINSPKIFGHSFCKL